MNIGMATNHRWRTKPCGDVAFFVELDSLNHAMGLRRALEASPPKGLRDVVATATTVLVVAEKPAYRSSLLHFVQNVGTVNDQGASGRTLSIPVSYDGDDIANVAEHLEMSRTAFTTWHSGQRWIAAFAGFAPGFVYLVGETGLMVPRRETPRQAVPAGAVAMAESYTSVYPRSSPGGWQLIGHTDVNMWEDTKSDPAFVHPGDYVEFNPTRKRLRLSSPTTLRTPARDQNSSQEDLRVLSTGLQSTIQDRGRFGHASLGVGSSGAMDRGSFALANFLVGNADSAAALELLGAGFAMAAGADQVIAVTGAATSLVIESPKGATEPRRRMPYVGEPFALKFEERLIIDSAENGLWSYVAIRGGLDVPSILGSRSTDVHSGLGPHPLEVGQGLSVFPAPVSMIVGESGALRDIPDNSHTLRVILGPRDDWFTKDALETFFGRTWTVSHQVNRTATRLQGTPLERVTSEELPSEGIVRGSIQVPSDGQPLIFGADHPPTGGYPVIGVVVDADLDKASQMTPGSIVTFVPYRPSTVRDAVLAWGEAT